MKNSKHTKRSYEKVKTNVRKPRQLVRKKRKTGSRYYRHPGIYLVPVLYF